MATINKRVHKPRGLTINGFGVGGLVTHNIWAGYDDILQHPVDGMQLPMVDFLTEAVRGSFANQDWVHVIELLTGTVGTSVFYEKKIGAAEAAGYIKHTLLNPVIWKMALSIRHRKYAVATGNYECKAADEADGISDLWVPTDSQNAPTYVDSARGVEITACTYGGTPAAIYHVVGLDLVIELPLLKLSQDGDVGYTVVEALLEDIKTSGALIMQHAEIANGMLKSQSLVKAAPGPLVLTVKQAQAAAAKALTINGVKFPSTSVDANANTPNPNEFSLPFMIVNNLALPLTIAGANKIITIA